MIKIILLVVTGYCLGTIVGRQLVEIYGEYPKPTTTRIDWSKIRISTEVDNLDTVAIVYYADSIVCYKPLEHE